MTTLTRSQSLRQTPTTPTPPVHDPAAARAFAIDAARLLADDKCQDVLVLEVRGLSQVCDYLVLASGTSDRQMRSAAEHVKDLAREGGHPVFRSAVDESSTWYVLDCVDVVVHVFEPNTRSHYDLEMLWGDAEQVPWERSDQVTRDRAGLGEGPDAE
ncbi:MAG TPA: ribosome silencing factor [Phycisphaerales bacterium]|nr:ribosome silencing factor [Phycisphaerales bacterium]